MTLTLDFYTCFWWPLHLWYCLIRNHNPFPNFLVAHLGESCYDCESEFESTCIALEIPSSLPWGFYTIKNSYWLSSLNGYFHDVETRHRLSAKNESVGLRPLLRAPHGRSSSNRSDDGTSLALLVPTSTVVPTRKTPQLHTYQHTATLIFLLFYSSVQ